MERTKFLEKIHFYLTVNPVCGLLGPRQIGKTTLAHMYAERYYPQDAYFFDLEDPLDLARLENPMLALDLPHKLIVIDEIQRRPDLFPVLRVLVDKTRTIMAPTKQHFLILGSASRDLIRQSSETLAGRIGYIELTPFSLSEVKDSMQLWLRGGFPHSYLASNTIASVAWRQAYISIFLENDIPNLGFDIPAQQMRRFWAMLAHYHGQTFNASELGRSLELSDHTVRKYLDILAGTFMMRIVLPWFENIHKRQVKAPKIYFRDSGIFHSLIGINDEIQLQEHPKLGASWEGFALEEVIRVLEIASEECFFWGIHSGAELDLFVFKYGKRLGFEVKYTGAPKITKSMIIALEDLNLNHLAIVYPGNVIFPLTETITAYGLDTIATGEFMQHIKKQLNVR